MYSFPYQTVKSEGVEELLGYPGGFFPYWVDVYLRYSPTFQNCFIDFFIQFFMVDDYGFTGSKLLKQ